MIEGWGIAVDAVVADFIAGAAEWLTVEGSKNADVVLVEGQGSINHPGYSGVTLGLLHGCCPDAMILCHQSSREFIGDYREAAWLRIPPLAEYVRLYESIGAAVHPTRVIGISLNTYDLSDVEARRACDRAEQETGLPATDPVRFDSAPLVNAIADERNRYLQTRKAQSRSRWPLPGSRRSAAGWRPGWSIETQPIASAPGRASGQGGCRLRWPAWLALGLGGLLLGAGILLFVAAHWDGLGPAQRFLLVVLTVGGLHLAAAFAADRSPGLSVALHACGTVALGGGIFLSGQIFHLQEHWPGGLHALGDRRMGRVVAAPAVAAGRECRVAGSRLACRRVDRRDRGPARAWSAGDLRRRCWPWRTWAPSPTADGTGRCAERSSGSVR